MPKNEWQKAVFSDKHHLVSKYRLKRGVKPMERNKLRIKRNKHVAWHILFDGKTLDEIITLLIRLKRFKEMPHATRLGENKRKRHNR